MIVISQLIRLPEHVYRPRRLIRSLAQHLHGPAMYVVCVCGWQPWQHALEPNGSVNGSRPVCRRNCGRGDALPVRAHTPVCAWLSGVAIQPVVLFSLKSRQEWSTGKQIRQRSCNRRGRAPSHLQGVGVRCAFPQPGDHGFAAQVVGVMMTSLCDTLGSRIGAHHHLVPCQLAALPVILCAHCPQQCHGLRVRR